MIDLIKLANQFVWHLPGCLFMRLGAFMNKRVKHILNRSSDVLTFRQIMECGKSGKFCRRSGHCQRHGERCRPKIFVIHVAGFPCTDWSTHWAGRLCEAGPTFEATMLWLAQRRLLAEEFVVHENLRTI